MRLVLEAEDRITPVLSRWQANADSARRVTVRRLAEALQEHVRAACPVGRHYDLSGTARPGGTLRDSLFFDVGPAGAVLLGVEHGLYVLGGTRPHPIRARRAPRLAFWWERAGRPFYGPRVSHPGHRANDFRQKALQVAFGDGTVERAVSAYWQALQSGG